MSAIVAVLYLLTLIALPSSAVVVLLKGRERRLNWTYAGLIAALWTYVATLFAFKFPLSPVATLVVGRLNFAAAVPAVTFGYLLVKRIAQSSFRGSRTLAVETTLLSIGSLCSSWIDKAELLQGTVHVTRYGFAFPIYAAHIVLVISATIWAAFRGKRHLTAATQAQLRLVGCGIAGTAVLALVTNVVLPYWFGDFRWIDVGAVGTVLFLAAVGLAVVLDHLFDLNLIVRTGLVVAGFVAFTLELYQLVLATLAHLVPLSNAGESPFAATFLVLVINAVTQEPLRRFLTRLLQPTHHRRVSS